LSEITALELNKKLDFYSSVSGAIWTISLGLAILISLFLVYRKFIVGVSIASGPDNNFILLMADFMLFITAALFLCVSFINDLFRRFFNEKVNGLEYEVEKVIRGKEK